MNQALFEHLAQRFHEASGLDVRADPRAAARLLEAAEVAKKDVTAAKEKTEALAKLLKEAGAVIYAQRPDAGIYREIKVPPGARVVDAEYKERR